MKGGIEVALQAQLDAVAVALGAERMRAADGYHYEAVRTLQRELVECLKACRLLVSEDFGDYGDGATRARALLARVTR